MKTYFTFGQRHTHRVNGITFDCDSVAVINADDESAARAKAFEYFGDKWCFSYPENQWNDEKMKYFPRGLIEVETPTP